MIYNIKEAVREAIKAGIEIGRKDYAARAGVSCTDAPEETKVVEVKAEAVKNETCSSSGDDDRRLNAFSLGPNICPIRCLMLKRGKTTWNGEPE